MAVLFSRAETVAQFCQRSYKKPLCELIYFEFGPVGREEMPFSYQQLWWPCCLAEQNHLCNLCSAYYEEHFCEIILNLDWHVVHEEIPFIFFIKNSGGHLV